MIKKLIQWILFSGFIFSSCSGPCPSLNDEKKAEINRQVSEVWDQLGQTVKNADAESYITFISQNSFLSMNTQGLTMTTGQAYADSVRSWFSIRKGVELLHPEVTITPLSGNLALLDQTAGLVTIAGNGKADTLHHTVSFFFQNEATGWKIIHGHESWR